MKTDTSKFSKEDWNVYTLDRLTEAVSRAGQHIGSGFAFLGFWLSVGMIVSSYLRLLK